MTRPLDIPIFSNSQVRHLLLLAGLDPEDLSDANLERIGVTSTKTQRAKVIIAYEKGMGVDDIFNELGGAVPKSSIRAYLCQYDPNGPWRQRRRRRRSDVNCGDKAPWHA